MKKISAWAPLLFSSLLAVGSGSAWGQEAFPSRPFTVLTNFAAGGGNTEPLARAAAAALNERTGQPAVVEPRPGANGAVGLAVLTRAQPDGYTIMLSLGSSITVVPHLTQGVGYDPLKDFTYITRMVSGPTVYEVAPNSPVKTFKQLIEMAKAKPDSVSITVIGAGSQIQLAAINAATGAKFLQVPFNGGPPALAAVLGGHVDVLMTGASSAAPRMKSGQGRSLAVSTAERSPVLPDVPTIAEAAVPGFDMGVWYGVVGPAGIPADRLNLIYTDIAAKLAEPKLREQLISLGFDAAAPNPPAQFAAFAKKEYEEQGNIIRKYNIQ